MRHLIAALGLSALGLAGASFAQTVDAAVEVKEGALRSFSADFEVGLATGLTASLQDEKWFVTGACSNRPTVKIAMSIGLSAVLSDRRVGIINSRLLADRVICITNSDELSDEMREALGLAQTGGGY